MQLPQLGLLSTSFSMPETLSSSYVPYPYEQQFQSRDITQADDWSERLLNSKKEHRIEECFLWVRRIRRGIKPIKCKCHGEHSEDGRLHVQGEIYQRLCCQDRLKNYYPIKVRLFWLLSARWPRCCKKCGALFLSKSQWKCCGIVHENLKDSSWFIPLQ